MILKNLDWLCLLREKCGCVPQRYLMTFMSFLGVVIVFILRTCLSMAILKMSPDNVMCRNLTNNATLSHFSENVCSSNMHEWSDHTKRQIIGSFYYGYLIAHLPGAYLARRIGGKYTLGLSVLLSSLCSILSPPAACYSSVTLIITRITMGLAEGPTFPALTELLSQWAPPFERTLLASIIFAGVQIGMVVSMTVISFMLEHMEWSQVFYILGGTGGVWFILWTLLCYNKPSQHPFISSKELDYLKEQIPEPHKDMSTPWMAMLKSKPLWALTLAEMGHDYGLYTMVSDLPIYYYDIVGVPFAVNGDLGSLPYLIMWLVSVLLGYTCDKLIALKWTTTTQLRRILSTIGAVVPSMGIVWASFITDKGTFTGVLIISLALMGCCYCSLRVNPLDLSPNHAATIMAIINGAGAITGAISPTIVGTFVTNEMPCTDVHQYQAERKKGWQNVFWIMFAVVVISNFPFVMFGSGDVQPWDKREDVPSPSDLRRRSTISGGEPIREMYRNYYPEQAIIEE